MTKLPATSGNVPVLAGDDGLARYLHEIRQFPMLDQEEEYILARRWREHEDVEAVHKLVTSHLRLVARIAMGYRGYGLPVSDLIAEGNVGMMQAVKRFDPDKGFRLSTYAMWWIRAAIQEYVLRSWSLVKTGTTAAQKKLFFNLRRLRQKLRVVESGDLPPEKARRIAAELGVGEDEVADMNRRLEARDYSLNAPLRAEDGMGGEWQDMLADDRVDQETAYAGREELEYRRGMLAEAMDVLDERERTILAGRRLREEPMTLEELSQTFGVSRERIRQIEVRAFEKVQRAVRDAAVQRNIESLPPPA